MSRFKDSWGKTKMLLSQLLCIGAVFTACTDDEVINQTDKAPLQVSVNTSFAKQSRAIVHGEWLPLGSFIGVSLFTPEGDDYDEQGYYNIQYKGMGDEEDQTWSSMGVTPAVSANEAILVAYHPYNDDQDLDITAMPVEIASQTDYMYSGPVTGITNAAPKADIVLDHALTAIRVKLVLGDFTGDASVSEIAVASPALASSAMLNTVDGSLNNITGQGDKFTLPVDFGLVAGDTDNDVMFVPDASVESGITTVSATIGGKKYTAGIEFDQAYKQGYIYTYTLTLNNSGFAVTKVNVNPWEQGNDESATLVPEKDNTYVIKIVASYSAPGPVSYIEEDGIAYNNNSSIAQSRSGETFEFLHNIKGFEGTIDWGDGTTTTYDVATDNPSHEYPNDGTEYIITAKGTMTGLGSLDSFSQCLKEVKYIGKDCGITSMEGAFMYCTSLTRIPQGLFDKCTKVKSFEGAFRYCAALQTIPEGLFDHCTEVTSFNGTFEGCTSLQNIPEGLFDYNTKVTSFEGTFQRCKSLTTIPEGLFDKCTEVTSFGGEDGITVSSWGGADTPNGVFCQCSNLTSIPVDLFKYNTKVIDMGGAFGYCTSLQVVPENIFKYNTEVVDMSGVFGSCEALTNIPVGIFDTNTKVLYFDYALAFCYALTGESPYTVIQVDGVNTKVHLYERENYPEYFAIPTPASNTYYNYCFLNDENLTDYNSIPADWKW